MHIDEIEEPPNKRNTLASLMDDIFVEVLCRLRARSLLMPPPIPTCILYVTPDLILKYADVTLANIQKRKMKHLKHITKTLAKAFTKNI
jgi:hypothetical protein